MAITTTKSLARFEVWPGNDLITDPHLRIWTRIEVDDPDDDALPKIWEQEKTLTKQDSEGNATDISNEDQLVQDVCAAIWS